MGVLYLNVSLKSLLTGLDSLWSFFFPGGIVLVLIKQAACEKKKIHRPAWRSAKAMTKTVFGLIEWEIVCLHLGMQNLTGIYNLIHLTEYKL